MLFRSCSCAPREGHLEAIYQIFEYIRSHLRPAAVLGSSRLSINGGNFKAVGWAQTYGDAKEEAPAELPEERGNPVEITLYVDAAHAGNLASRRSHTGIIIFLSSAPITWHSKRQGAAEAPALGPGLAALGAGAEASRGLRCKLRMMGIPAAGPSNALCANKPAADNASLPEAQLKKKRLLAACHCARGCCAKLAARAAPGACRGEPGGPACAQEP